MLVARDLAGENQDAGHADENRRLRLRNTTSIFTCRASALSNGAGGGEARGVKHGPNLVRSQRSTRLRGQERATDGRPTRNPCDPLEDPDASTPTSTLRSSPPTLRRKRSSNSTPPLCAAGRNYDREDLLAYFGARPRYSKWLARFRRQPLLWLANALAIQIMGRLGQRAFFDRRGLPPFGSRPRRARARRDRRGRRRRGARRDVGGAAPRAILYGLRRERREAGLSRT